MHYYQFNIADYRKDTQHLTPIEHYIYRELMDWHYLDERPIPLETKVVSRRLRLGSDHDTMIHDVLTEYFVKTEEGWFHRRILSEIEVYHKKAETARINGSKGGRPPKPRKTKVVNLANPEKTGSKANHKPLTINHIYPPNPPKRGNGRFKPPSNSDVENYLTDLKETGFTADQFCDFYQAQDWKLSNGNKMKDWKAAVRTWRGRRQNEKKTYSGNEI